MCSSARRRATIKGPGSDEFLSDWVKRVDHLHAQRHFHGASACGKKFFETVVRQVKRLVYEHQSYLLEKDDDFQS